MCDRNFLRFPNFVANACCNPCCENFVSAQRVESTTNPGCDCRICIVPCCCGCCRGCGNVGGANDNNWGPPCGNVGGSSDCGCGNVGGINDDDDFCGNVGGSSGCGCHHRRGCHRR